MNHRWGISPFPGNTLSDGNGIPSCVPLVSFSSQEQGISPEGSLVPVKAGSRPVAKKEHSFHKDSQLSVWRDGALHIISESYGYKTETYYTILRHELDGTAVRPASSAVLDAYVVPVCLERAQIAGIPVCEWGISMVYAPLPSILYGLNYFANTSDFVVVKDNEKAKETVRHITNKGKYPFCYQKLSDNAEVTSCISIFGRTATGSDQIDTIALQVYDLFAIPLVRLVLVKDGDTFRLSSLSRTRYTQMSVEERSILSAYISNQEFL
ncbi:RimK-like ATPgrasp N-terminal domain-containing protein [uncultured Methanoregula sp.]|uniref:RimK-like ATPgrasp N-terminal domain-containing protein n=1 Tax=uncultured Methanoregula sp. TaxID=1005933 RepID=UPI002AAAA908|nr:RimK-like ATPgrasp N-terminal domain-containing protein [uncultured Methanoregula sp.]